MLQTRQLRLLILFFFAAAIGGCVASGVTYVAEVAKPGAGEARVYIYRPMTYFGIANGDVPLMHLDGRKLAPIRIGGYLVLTVAAGRQHKLYTTEVMLGGDTGKVRGETTFSAPSGLTLYLRYTESLGSIVPIPLPVGVVVLSTGNFRFEFVPEGEARGELEGLKKIALEKAPG